MLLSSYDHPLTRLWYRGDLSRRDYYTPDSLTVMVTYLVVAYAPTEGLPDPDKDQFYQQLSSLSVSTHCQADNKKTQMLNPVFWWLLRSLVGSRGRVYPSKQQACQALNQFQNFNFSAVVAPLLLEPKANQMEIMKHVNCMHNVILVLNKERL